MDEYASYVNTIKNVKGDHGDYSHRKSYHHSSSSHYKKKKYTRDFKDLDDPEQNAPTGNNNQLQTGRKLISYDDL
jgi:hypothetical protein